ncbi:PQQ-binding-like beta-propeller repeat protein [Micrococcaceae bacterium RIT802]|nr:PQQ-binding-like beta-propeller repeat protein [Micrococcaceae bacterium RIT 802]
MRTIGVESAKVLRRHASVFTSEPKLSASFLRDATGRLRIAAGCAALDDQLQVVDAATGKLVYTATPFPGSGGGVSEVLLEKSGGALLAFGASPSVMRISSSRAVSKAFTAAAGTTTAAYQPTRDSRGRIWVGTYPTGSATRFDPATGKRVQTKRLGPTSQYVRALAVDERDYVYAGTGVQRPSMFTWHTEHPDQITEIPLPGVATTGYVSRIEAHGHYVFVYYSGATGNLTFNVWHPATNSWVNRPWNWAPSAQQMTSLRGSGTAYAVWNTTVKGVKTHKLMAIDTRSLASAFVCNVPEPADTIHVDGSTVHILGPGTRPTYTRVALGTRKATAGPRPQFSRLTREVQALTAYGEKLYFGAYLGDGICSLDPDTGKTWRSAAGSGIGQIEGMHVHGGGLYVGSYTGAEVYRVGASSGVVKRITDMDDEKQSRPLAWASAAGRVVTGTAAKNGFTTGALAIFNPANDKDIRIVASPVSGQTVVGLVGEGDLVYGTTSRMGGHGAKLDSKSAHVFAYNVRTRRRVWARQLLSENEINSPILVRGVLYVSTNNGIIRLNKATGSAVKNWKVMDRTAAVGYRTSTIAYLKAADKILHVAGGVSTVVDVARNTQKIMLNGKFKYPVLTPAGRLFYVEDGKDIVEVDPVQRPTIRSSADLVSVGSNGWLYVSRSNRRGTFAEPLRADSGFEGFVRTVNVVDWNDDGCLDVLTTHADGRLVLHKAVRTGGFEAPRILGKSGWGKLNVAAGKWGSRKSVLYLDRQTGVLRSRDVRANGSLSSSRKLASGWKGRSISLMVPSRTSTPVILAQVGNSLYRYTRTANGKPSSTGRRIATGFGGLRAMSPVVGHKPKLNGIGWIDEAGRLRYNDVASGAVGRTAKYKSVLKHHKLASY